MNSPSLTLLLVIAAFSMLSYAILTGVIVPAFDDLDLSAAKTNLIRAERAIQNDMHGGGCRCHRGRSGIC